jgi:UDP-N-acetylmuramoyl-tripeptide--D-alanyl-D-alanine ligase
MSISLSKKELLGTLTLNFINQAPVASSNLISEIFSKIEFDSRKIKGGELFIALKGETSHGESFLEQAFSLGAKLALVENAETYRDSPYTDRLILVENTLGSLTTLAQLHRKKLTCPVLGITGTIGKTTVRSMANAILSRYLPGTASTKSFNNHIGVPYTICNADENSKWLALEMGMNHSGELDLLSKIARPNACAITTITPVHMEFFQSLAEVADSKFEILNHATDPIKLTIKDDDKNLLDGLERWKSKTLKPVEVVKFGSLASSPIRLTNYESKGLDGSTVEISCFDKKIKFSWSALGLHNAVNATAAIASAKLIFPELDENLIAQSLSAYTPESNRLNLSTLKNGTRLIDDSYNASPAAMKAALELVESERKKGFRIGLILGSMAELGINSIKYHKDVADIIARISPEFLITVGDHAKEYGSKLDQINSRFLCAKSPEEAAEICKVQDSTDIILVKASRSIGLDKTVAMLIKNSEK